MGFFTESEFQLIGRTSALVSGKSVSNLLKEEAAVADSDYREYDVFLSHSIKDANIILGIRIVLIRQGLKVYVDWIEDPALDSSNVTPKTAEKLRRRMRQSKSMIYAHSINSPGSKWMPWELGFFDGFNGNIAILPIMKNENDSFKGQEFLGLYPYIDKSANTTWVNRGNAPMSAIGESASGQSFQSLQAWMREKAKVKI